MAKSEKMVVYHECCYKDWVTHTFWVDDAARLPVSLALWSHWAEKDNIINNALSGEMNNV